MSGAEEWRPIAGFPDYAVSNTGRIKRVLPDSYGRYAGRIIQPKATKAGYSLCSLMQDGRRSTVLVSRIVCAAFHGGPPTADHHAAHNDGNRKNNAAGNLRWASPSENELDKRAHGTVRSGERHHSFLKPDRVAKGSRVGTSKLTEASVAQIRMDARPRAEIAAAFAITETHVSDIRSRRAWRHVP